MSSETTIQVQLVRSSIGRPKIHKVILRILGLTRLNKIVTLKDTPSVKGMIKKVIHLVKIIDV